VPQHVKESRFEADIVQSLLKAGGYEHGRPENYDAISGLDVGELLAFIEDTQPTEWKLLTSRYGGHEDIAQTKFISRLIGAIERRGTLDVLRKGFDDQGVKFRVAYFRPASGLNPLLHELYQRNRLTVTRQVRYSTRNDNSLDLVLFVNGLPLGTAELKSPLNGQTVDDALAQYRTDRDPRELMFASRALVHFAIDPHLAYMTTRLEGESTVFLPFNQGSAPGRLSCGEGNPPNSAGYETAYLWERVWSYDAWLDILGRFIEVVPDDGPPPTTRVIFPRFHQWDGVTRLEAAALTDGPGRSYLVQHSAGSGKSNSIGWLAHRLSLLHDAADVKVFGKVIVVTDRRVLDEQLRATVQQFENVPGTIVTVEGKSGSKSAELADALSGKAQIVTVTLETFPFVLEKIAESDLARRNYAIIVDEAHSSQTGEAAVALKQALGATSIGVEEDHEAFDAEAAVAAIVAARGKQPNLSFFAFTATPKDRTVELFGTLNADGNKEPFHLYTMRQAIEEKFILDVLKNYTIYSTYYRIATASEELAAEEVNVRKASAALRRFVTGNPVLIQQKAAVIVEHFRSHTAKELGGRAKAMVVTDSRPSAVKYKRAIDSHIKEHGYRDIRALVAFSGTVRDELGDDVTESSLNGFPESQTSRRFKGEPPFSPRDYQVLIVAEKFQTGFDEPYLHTMFVDKPLKGLNAVQTLSRLNRIAPGKDGTFILDFRNDVDDIQAGFQRYYEAVVMEPTNPNVLYDLRTRIWDSGILDPAEVAAASDAYFGADPSKRNLKDIYANLDPAVDRFEALAEGYQLTFKDAVDQFVRVYAFLGQVIPFTDAELERLYVYVKALRQLLKDASTGGLDLGNDVVLTHLRLEERGAEDIGLVPGEIHAGKVFVGEGEGEVAEPVIDTLGAVIDVVNERFGAELDDRDRLEIEKIKLTLLQRDDLKAYALANSLQHYTLEFGPAFKGAVLDQEERNRRLYELLLSKPELASLIQEVLAKETYESLREEKKPLD
jgi:type I restriction enzyme R subunit